MPPIFSEQTLRFDSTQMRANGSRKFMVSPKFIKASHSQGRRGGATFTLLIFVLLLVTTGLMYYYFHRCQVLEGELAKWKTGIHEREVATVPATAITKTPTPKNSSTLRDLAASLGARLTGTPAIAPATRTTPTPEPTPETTPELTHVPPVAETKEATPTPAPVPQEELPAPEATPTPTHTPTPRAQTPKPSPTTKPKNTPISSLYDVKPSSSSGTGDEEPAVRVRAPKRSPTPGTKLNLNNH